jgi:LPS export ABC transporter protein LptC
VSASRWLRIKARAGRVLLAALVVSVALSVYWYRRMAGEGQPQAPASLPANDTKAEMVTRDFKHVETKMDRTIWILESERAEMFDERASLHTVKVTWYGEPGDVTVVITSAEGAVDFKQRTAELSGKVRVARADGAVLSTEQMFWDEKTKSLRAPLPVVITTPSFTFRGEGLDGDLAAERITLKGRVHGEIRAGSLGPGGPS